MTVDETVIYRPTYRIDRSFEWNAEHGPDFAGPFPAVPATPMTELFGIPVRSRFGVAASILVNARWFETYSRLGFDLLTYKTIRIKQRLAHPWPNWAFLDDCEAARIDDPDAVLLTASETPRDPLVATAVGSIGMPSSAPEFWLRDIRRCRDLLRPGQALIVSIVATADSETGPDEFVAEFEQLATMARDAGAQAIEANLSCPNVARREGEVYRDVELTGRIAAATRQGAGDLPLLLKLGPIEDPAEMARLLRAVSGRADGIVMINAASRRVVDAAGAPSFGAGRVRAGIIGGALHGIALRCVRQAVAIVQRDRLGLEILAVGGASSPERVRAFRDAGAYAVLVASAAAWDPGLAVRIKSAGVA
jgi:dihydroorotate dehydrogenase (NAD+) catalytic subunit